MVASTKSLRVIGLMSGTSLDGVDAAGIVTDGVTVSAFGPALTMPYGPALRAALRELLARAPTLAADDPALLDAERRLTDAHAEAVAALDWPAELIGFHGQTILHRPAERRTWQIGDAARLAALTDTPVAYEFRSADVAAGGQGAPLAPLFHAALADGMNRPLAVLNIGGVANVTWIGPDEALLAMDTGPGNGPLDDFTRLRTGQPFDRGGELALSGHANATVLARLMADPFFARAAPKSIDRLEFAHTLAGSGLDGLSTSDGAATLVAFTAVAVAAAPLPSNPREWLVCGGGRHNQAMMEELAIVLAPATVRAVETVGWNGDALEAQCFGYLAARVVAGLPLSVSTTTGVLSPTLGGKIAMPVSRPRAPSRGD